MTNRRAMRAAPFIISMLLTGCGLNEVEIGNYEARGVRTESCGEGGLLAAPPEIGLKVELRLVGKAAHWNHGTGVMIGAYAKSDDTFAVGQNIEVDMRQDDEEANAAAPREVIDLATGELVTSESDALPPCIIQRRLEIIGTLLGEQSYDTFDATMSFIFQPSGNSSCGDLLSGDTPIAEQLPCTVSYQLTGERN